MSNKGKYYVTTAIAYTSGKPHIGNTYEIILADSIARYRRQEGYDVFFQTGTDEHGQKIELKAQEAGVTPKEFVDKAAAESSSRIWDLMNTSYDKFIRTTDADHERQVQEDFQESCTIREISTRAITRDFTVRPASPSGRNRSWWTANVRTAAERCSRPRRRLISSV